MSEITLLAKRNDTRIRLDYLDGIRGFAALYVTAFHAWLCWTMEGGYSDLVYYSSAWLSYGRQAVAVFIVLSGYCLMLPLVRSTMQGFPGGVWEYFKRRAWRILPPYFGALALSIAAISALPSWVNTERTWWATMEPAFGAGNLISHIFLVHNLSDQWVYRINSPMWSVAMEWQIYFLFPLVLLPIWRRAGILPLVLIAFFVGLFPVLVLKKLSWTAPWFVGHFALGMTGAVIGFSSNKKMSVLRQRTPWGWFAVLGVLMLVGVSTISLRLGLNDWKNAFLTDLMAGFAAISLIIYCTRHLTNAVSDSVNPAVLRILGCSFAVFLGKFSYSLYLTHAPVIGGAQLIFRYFGASSNLLFFAMLLIAVPISIAAAYGFYLLFEKPIVERRKHRLKQTLTPTARETNFKVQSPTIGQSIAPTVD